MTNPDLAALADRFGLAPVGARPGLGSYLAETWRRRSFAITLANYRIQSENERNRLGIAWVVIRPLLNAVVYGVVFGLLLGSNRPPDFVPFLLVGVFIFEYFSQSLSDGSKAITSNEKLVRSLSFPRILLPVSALFKQIYKLGPILVVLAGLLLVFQVPITVSWLMIFPVMALMTLFNGGVAMIAARLSVHLRDIQQVIPFVNRLLFYSSGVFFQIDQVLQPYPTVLAIARLNPAYEFIHLSREALIPGIDHQPDLWAYAAIWSILVFLFGVLFFWQAESRYGRE
ncbi:MAG: phosphate transporter permease [Naasia sp.]|uniref:ABC transporter permease n=1 Tax=Naasia sp. TaxID=2546198 RepID=UPI0026138FB2|nr:ABC transporter permease [Naasia sp.]MCU1569969.1 phosphate transporter permease [Naasia sp.]